MSQVTDDLDDALKLLRIARTSVKLDTRVALDWVAGALTRAKRAILTAEASKSGPEGLKGPEGDPNELHEGTAGQGF